METSSSTTCRAVATETSTQVEAVECARVDAKIDLNCLPKRKIVHRKHWTFYMDAVADNVGVIYYHQSVTNIYAAHIGAVGYQYLLQLYEKVTEREGRL